jgi:hypothetical protein
MVHAIRLRSACMIKRWELFPFSSVINRTTSYCVVGGCVVGQSIVKSKTYLRT